jgi:hypothetical protein
VDRQFEIKGDNLKVAGKKPFHQMKSSARVSGFVIAMNENKKLYLKPINKKETPRIGIPAMRGV